MGVHFGPDILIPAAMNSKVVILLALVASCFADDDLSIEDLKPEYRSADDSIELQGLHTTKYVYSGRPLLLKSAEPQAPVAEVQPSTGTNIKTVAPVIGTPQVLQYSAPQVLQYSAPLVSGHSGLFRSALPISSYVSKPLLQQYSAFPFLQSSNFIVKASDEDADDDDAKKVVFRGAFSPLVPSFPSASVMTYGVNADSAVAQTYTALSGGASHSVTTNSVVPQTYSVTTKGVVPQTFNFVPATYSAFQPAQGFVPSVYSGFSGLNPFFYSAVETKDDSVESDD